VHEHRIRLRGHAEVTEVSHEWNFWPSGPHLDCSVLANLHGGHWLQWMLDAVRTSSSAAQSSWRVESAIHLGLGPGQYSADEEILQSFGVKEILAVTSLPAALISATTELTDSFALEDLLQQAQPMRANYRPTP
jgi:hypothetical protein